MGEGLLGMGWSGSMGGREVRGMLLFFVLFFVVFFGGGGVGFGFARNACQGDLKWDWEWMSFVLNRMALIGCGMELDVTRAVWGWMYFYLCLRESVGIRCAFGAFSRDAWGRV